MRPVEGDPAARATHEEASAAAPSPVPEGAPASPLVAGTAPKTEAPARDLASGTDGAPQPTRSAETKKDVSARVSEADGASKPSLAVFAAPTTGPSSRDLAPASGTTAESPVVAPVPAHGEPLVALSDAHAGAESGAPRRALPPLSSRTKSLHELAARLRAPGGAIEDPCLLPAGQGCARTALSPFFASMDSLARGTTTRPTVITAFGNSLIAGDRIVDILRMELGDMLGAAGRGVLLVDRMAPYGGRERTASTSTGWEPRTLGELRAPPLPFGITGVYHVATESGARGRFKLEGEPHGTLWWQDVPGGGALTVTSQGQVLARTTPTGNNQGQSTRFDIPADAKWLDVSVEGKDAVVQGVVLEHDRPGIVLDMLGVPSSDARLFGRFGDDLLRTQLTERSPRLLLFFLGGNERKRLEWKRTTPEVVRSDLFALLRRVRAVSPNSACMVVGPIDAVRTDSPTGPGKDPRPFLDAVIAAEREVATREGCAFFDLFSAMGGTGSLMRFHAAGFVHDDLVHPRGKGLDVLGQLVTDALLRAWVEGDAMVPALTSERDAAPEPPPTSSAQVSETVP
ncbi:hypothetical protein JGU66_29845 [Myxococcaceae bacterium JPH2]|nr:hypothetical protein [Myxococcaceae bacterium JPH2]